MPPKKVDSSAPVYTMPHERQVELLSEALLREYMHKRKFTETLQTFDAEHPRDADTISSRALMSDLMALDPHKQRQLKEEGAETIMEMLCYLRVQSRLELEELKQRASLEVPPTPEKLKKSRKDKKKKKKGTLDKSSHHHGSLHEKQSRRGGARREQGHTDGDSSDCSSHSNTSSSDSIASNSNNNNTNNIAAGGGGGGCRRNNDFGGNNDTAMEKQTRQGGWTCDESVDHLGKGVVRSIMELLCGGNPLPSSFVELGFVFGEDVEYGLLQRSRGPDGIMAVVQAFVCVYFFRGGFVDVQHHRKQCLLRALITLLSGVQPNPRRVCLVDGSVKIDSAEVDMMHLRVSRDFSNNQEVDDSLCTLLESWMQPTGSGVFCFLLSVLLSRGLQKAASDMEGAGTLIDAKGCCSTNMTRLLLLGEGSAASPDDLLTSLMADDDKGRMDCGYVSADHDDQLLDDQGARTPRYPVWVVHHDGRFVVLFLKKDDRLHFEQRKKMRMSAASDVFFYEPAAGDGGEMFFTVSVNTAPGMARGKDQGGSILHEAIYKIPLWNGEDIDWNGFEPPF